MQVWRRKTRRTTLPMPTQGYPWVSCICIKKGLGKPAQVRLWLCKVTTYLCKLVGNAPCTSLNSWASCEFGYPPCNLSSMQASFYASIHPSTPAMNLCKRSKFLLRRGTLHELMYATYLSKEHTYSPNANSKSLSIKVGGQHMYCQAEIKNSKSSLVFLHTAMG